MWYLIKGNIDVQRFEKVCKEHNLDPKKVVFVFPGNRTHHAPGTTPFTVKSGGGLAAVARLLGESGYPTLSLPTTSMEKWSSDDDQQDIVDSAINDLTNAINQGYHILLPVRDHNDNTYFNQGFAAANQLEPNFWGGIQKASNQKLANYYSQQLDRLIQLANEGNGLEVFVDNAKSPVSGPAVVRTKVFPKSYDKIYNQFDDEPLTSAKALLKDYTKGNSYLKRLVTFHARRHHADAVNRIVHDDKITDLAGLIEALEKISPPNAKGSLAKRIDYIKMRNPQVVEALQREHQRIIM